ILAYISVLSEYGTRIGEPIVKHIDGDIWELRPLSNRIFFFYWKDNTFVLLHYYIKKSQKAPKKEINKAKNNLKDFLERNDDL
ncbi:MAG: type II toxin-antitoxin system RelE/ParE family toxin, partial [Eubacterium sp.]|nr:type II toxin-antitoxin system RelE/ParE family toxin [Eubacterium sp.]